MNNSNFKENKIFIESFNPYEAIFPNRKLITLDTLILIKQLRQEGYDVQVLPDDDRPVEYIFQKGLKEFLSNPITLIILNIPITIILNLISNYVQKRLDILKKVNEDRNLFIIIDKSTNITYNYEGEILSNSILKNRERKIFETKLKFKNAFEKQAPSNFPPVPIFYEHKPEIVGWCRLSVEQDGLKLYDGNVIDKRIKDKLIKGKIKGLSVTGIAKKTECSLCKGDFISCIHLTNEETKVTNTIQKADFIEVSLVKTPINKNCIVSLINKYGL